MDRTSQAMPGEMPARATRVRVLLVEDNADDAGLILRELNRAGLKPESRQVQTEDDFRRAVQEFRPQVILSDFSMPRFDGMRALALACELCPDIPFLFVSGTLGEEYAIRALRDGARDYVLKANLARLPPAVERALTDAREHALKRDIEQALRASEERYRAAFEHAAVGVIHTSLDGDVLMVNPKFCDISGYQRADLVQLGIRDLSHPADIAASVEGRSKMLSGTGAPYERELRLRRRDATMLWVSITTSLVTGQDGKPLHFISVVHDISARKRAEQDAERFRTALDHSGDIIVIVDRDTLRHVDVNETACKALGYTREELLRLGPADTLPVTREELARTYDALIADPANQHGIRSYYRCKDGSHLPFESTRRALRIGDAWVIVAISRDIRERLVAEQALQDSAALQGAILASSLDALVTLDHEGLIVEFNPAAEKTFGFAREQVLGKRIVESIIPVQYREAHLRGIARYLATGQGAVIGKRIEITALRADGSEFPVELAIAPVGTGEKPLFTAFIRDITARKESEAKIRRLNRVHAVLSQINAAIVRINERQALFEEVCRVALQAGRFTLAWIGMVDSAEKRLVPVAWSEGGAGFMEALKRRRIGLDEDRPGPAVTALQTRKPFVQTRVQQDPTLVLKKELHDLGTRSVAALPLIVSGEAIGVLVLQASEAGFFDDEEMKLLQELAGDVAFALEHIARSEKLEYLALHDPLTGLANRRLLAERLGQSIRDAGRAGGKLALAWIDLERFATINESLGRQAGDALIRLVGERLARAVGADNVARITGAEFAIALAQVKGRSEAGRQASSLARACFADPFAVQGHEITVAAKAGLALFPNDGADPETLLGNAEAALRKSKETGERQTFYSPSLIERTGATLTLENKLRRALERDEFVLHYQPKIDIESQRIVGLEALIRWQSPELGLVPPAQFIGLMERTGMILDVGAWALKRAALDHRQWAGQGLKPPRVAVNVSAIQLRQRDFVQAVEQAIAEGLAPTSIDLEITESLVMADTEANIEKLKRARQLGVEIAIDDFGTGYSSLSYLAKLPVQTLKIDRSFIVAMLTEPDTMSLVQTIISLAHTLRLKVVAEGVETQDQAKVLRLLRCDQIQGYVFSKPLPFAGMEALLKRS